MLEIKPEAFRLIFKALWKNKLLIILITLAGAFAGLAYAETRSDEYMYRATASACVMYDSYQGQLSSNSILMNYSDIATSKRVCEYAASLLEGGPVSAEQIQKMLSIQVSDNSYIMKINAVSSYPILAVLVANAVAESFVTQVSNISNNYSLQVLDIAEKPSVVKNNRKTQIPIVSAGGVFALLCGYIAVRELLSDKIRLISQCVDDEDEILAIIPYAG